MDSFIAGLPKVELHMHIEGSLEPDLMFALAQRNKIQIPFASVDDVRRAYQFTNLQSFLDIYYQGMNVLHTEQDFYDLTMAYMTRIHADNVVHTEIFFDPQGHTDRGVAFATVLNGIMRALDDAEQKFGITSRLIMCFLRHLPEEAAFKTLEQALPYKDKIIGVGLDSSEVGHPPSKFARVFARAREEGFIVVAHAGEEGPPDYVREALDQLKIARMDHGNRSLEDVDLARRIAEMGIGLTVCPLSNLKLCGVKDMRDHPIKEMLALGIRATVNSDDPSYFGGYMNDNFKAITDALNLTQDDLATLVRNSIDVAFIDDGHKARLHQTLDRYLQAQAA